MRLAEVTPDDRVWRALARLYTRAAELARAAEGAEEAEGQKEATPRAANLAGVAKVGHVTTFQANGGPSSGL